MIKKEEAGYFNDECREKLRQPVIEPANAEHEGGKKRPKKPVRSGDASKLPRQTQSGGGFIAGKMRLAWTADFL